MDLTPRLAASAVAQTFGRVSQRIAVIDTTVPLTDAQHPFAPGLGTRAHATAHGKVLLASLPRAARCRYLAEHGTARLTERTITDEERFEAEVASVRHRGRFPPEAGRGRVSGSFGTGPPAAGSREALHRGDPYRTGQPLLRLVPQCRRPEQVHAAGGVRG
ncbi:IclR family transcriptional regulator C-terminal domain-containing protein [Streptomyces sp. NPDC057623]|uniref:IclR family transcriptional regulator domain-containing protein n=1 Tax=Streptomyces sp. NPDC057623 TaxID=3346187 RepID=UPI0036AA6E38